MKGEIEEVCRLLEQDLKRYFIDHEGVEWKVTEHTPENDYNILLYKFGRYARRLKPALEKYKYEL